MKYDIGLIGLAVMGQNLVLNMLDHGFKVAVYNRTYSKVEQFIAGEAAGKAIFGTDSIEEFINSLSKPHIVMMMIKSGQPVDDMIDVILPYLQKGDIIIDGGNSNFKDTIRRTEFLTTKGLNYIGAGISGGETGARHGPSIMPGGNPAAWNAVEPIFKAIAAKVDDGSACCEWMGSDGAGHYVKMVHNGIEYGYMQMIAEIYHIQRDLLKLSAETMASNFKRWNKGKLSSYLIEITSSILEFKDTDGKPLVDKIRDTAEQKGTGRWTSQVALDAGVPLTLVTEAVFCRALSSYKSERMEANSHFGKIDNPIKVKTDEWIDDLENALYLAEIISYAQGYMLFQSAGIEYGWNLKFSEIARIWRNGCIIRSVLLGRISAAYEQNPNLNNLLLDPYFKQELITYQASLRRTVARAVEAGIPVPTLSAALAFFDGYRCANLPANLTQAQRDYFGSHTYERIDAPDRQYFHTNWTGESGSVTASTYQA